MIDWTVSVGNLVQIVLLIAGGLSAFFVVRGDITVLKNDMRAVKDEQIALNETMGQLTTVLTTLAVQQVRLERAEKTIDEMRHGQGFVNPMRS